MYIARYIVRDPSAAGKSFKSPLKSSPGKLSDALIFSM